MQPINQSIQNKSKLKIEEFVMSDQAIEALSSYDWGKDYGAIKPIEEAIVSTKVTWKLAKRWKESSLLS